MIELRWVSSGAVSAFVAAAELSGGRNLADRRLSAAIARPADDLAAALDRAVIPRTAFFAHLVSLAAGIEDRNELVVLAIQLATGSRPDEDTTSRVTAAVASIEAAFRRAYPQAAAEIELRAGPLREQWEARGPGLLAAIGRATDPSLIVERAEVVLIQPALGGGGWACLSHNIVVFEAVLTNPEPALPEIVRLAWLLSQLHCDLPRFSEGISRERLPRVAALALVPAALAAAEYVELSRDDPRTVQTALVAWRLVDTENTRQLKGMVEMLTTWWETYRTTRPPWAVALAALDRLLPAHSE